MPKLPFSFWNYFTLWRALANDPRTSSFSKWLPIAALLYLISPIDFIPDFIQFFGERDNVGLIALLLWIAWKLIPKHLIEEQKQIIVSKKKLY